MLDDYGHLKEEFYTMKSDFSVCIKELSEAIHILKEIQEMWDVLPSEIIDKVDTFIEKATTESKKILYTEIKDTKMSYVLTEDIAKIGKKLTETEEFPITELERI